MATSRAGYILRRSVQTVFLLWFILTFLFFFFRLMPGSYTDIMLGQGASAESIARFEARWGLDAPLWRQYIDYFINFLRLDFGASLQAQVPVLDYIGIRMFNSFILVAPAITAAYIMGSVLGSILGSVRGSITERVGVVGMVGLSSFPGFFVGIIVILIFANYLGWLPTSGMVTASTYAQFGDAAWWRPYLTTDFLVHYILPFSVIAIRGLANPGMIMRTSVVEVKNQDFSYYHRVTGLPYSRRLRHIGKHAILPVVTLYPVSMVRAISGLVVLEVVFNWPGIGNLLVQSVFARDFPVIQFIFFLAAAFVVISNLFVDILYGVIDPRVSVAD